MSLTGATSTITLDDGTPAFRKALAQAPAGFFAFEAAGLQALRDFGARVPKVYEVTDEHLVIEVVEANYSTRISNPEYAFGQELARLHLGSQQAVDQHQTFGSLEGLRHWFLGGAEIDLQPTTTLYESLVVNRILPLTQRAIDAGRLDSTAFDMARALTEQHFGPLEPPTLVHGDLWAGNRLVDGSGASWLIDPSCHWGHREQDIAMMQLFGGFGPEVIESYQDTFPLAEGWQNRVSAFQLVPLLVHAILFGGGYGAATLRAFEQALQGGG